MTSLTCDVCPRACTLEEGETGPCKVRANIGGANVDRLYSQLSPEPRHAVRGIEVLHVAWLPGCNLSCQFCGHPNVSRPPGEPPVFCKLEPFDLVAEAVLCGARDLAFFGGEPALHHEYVVETCALARDRGILCFLETNGYVEQWVMEKISRAVDTLFIGIKGSASPRLYAAMNADPQIVLESAKTAWPKNPETMRITNLVGPDIQPTASEDLRLAMWIRDNVSPQVRIDVNSAREPAVEAVRKPKAGDEEKAWELVSEVARRLAEGGLENVWAEDGRIMPPGPGQWVRVE